MTRAEIEPAIQGFSVLKKPYLTVTLDDLQSPYRALQGLIDHLSCNLFLTIFKISKFGLLSA